MRLHICQNLCINAKCISILTGQIEGPPKTYITADKYVYFKPRVQVELDTQDRWDTVTEVYIKGECYIDLYQRSL